jgi:hypothetical protein
VSGQCSPSGFVLKAWMSGNGTGPECLRRPAGTRAVGSLWRAGVRAGFPLAHIQIPVHGEGKRKMFFLQCSRLLHPEPAVHGKDLTSGRNP